MAKPRRIVKKGQTRTDTMYKLDDIGIDAICDMVIEGVQLRRIATNVEVPLSTLMYWVAGDPARVLKMNEARTMTARLWDEFAEDILVQAKSVFGLAKGKELAHHYRWRATSIAPREYGSTVAQDRTPENPLPNKVIIEVQSGK